MHCEVWSDPNMRLKAYEFVTFQQLTDFAMYRHVLGNVSKMSFIIPVTIYIYIYVNKYYQSCATMHQNIEMSIL